MASQVQETKTPRRSVHWARLKLVFGKNKTPKEGNWSKFTPRNTSEQDQELASPSSSPREHALSFRLLRSQLGNQKDAEHPQESLCKKLSSGEHSPRSFPSINGFKSKQMSLLWMRRRKTSELDQKDTTEAKTDSSAYEKSNEPQVDSKSRQQEASENLTNLTNLKLDFQGTEGIDGEDDKCLSERHGSVNRLISPVSTSLSNSHGSLSDAARVQHNQTQVGIVIKPLGEHDKNTSEQINSMKCEERPLNQTAVMARRGSLISAEPEKPKKFSSSNSFFNATKSIMDKGSASSMRQLSSFSRVKQVSSFLTSGESPSGKGFTPSSRTRKSCVILSNTDIKLNVAARKTQSADDGECPWGLKIVSNDSEDSPYSLSRNFRMFDLGLGLKSRKLKGGKSKIGIVQDQDNDEKKSEVPQPSEVIQSSEVHQPIELLQDDFIDFSLPKQRWKVNWTKDRNLSNES